MSGGKKMLPPLQYFSGEEANESFEEVRTPVFGITKQGSFFVIKNRYLRTIFDDILSSENSEYSSPRSVNTPSSTGKEESADISQASSNDSPISPPPPISLSPTTKRGEESEEETGFEVGKVPSFIINEDEVEPTLDSPPKKEKKEKKDKKEKKSKKEKKEKKISSLKVKRVKSYDDSVSERKSLSLRDTLKKKKKAGKKKLEYLFSEKDFSSDGGSSNLEGEEMDDFANEHRNVRRIKSDADSPSKSLDKSPLSKEKPMSSAISRISGGTAVCRSASFDDTKENSKKKFTKAHRRTNSHEISRWDHDAFVSKTLRHKPHMEIQSQMPDEDKPPSQETLAKVRKMKMNFEEYYWELLTYINSRRKRESKFEVMLSEEQKSVIEKEIMLREHRTKETILLRARRLIGGINNFQFLQRIGKGAFGEVFLCRKKGSDELVALKKISKSNLNIKNKIAHVKIEQDVMVDNSSLWLVQLYYAFQDSEYIYFAMEYIPGGDMRTFLDEIFEIGQLTEDEARFFIAEMFVAVDTLHKLGYIHRDLKPDNFLRDRNGHIKLADFGLSKKGVDESYSAPFRGQLPTVKFAIATVNKRREMFKKQRKTAYSLVGSPDYMAVEVLREEGYDFSADWWSLACILFEMLVGFPPFTDDTPHDVFANVIHYQTVLENPDQEISESAWDLITNLICEPQDRLGFEEIKQHNFFEDMDWSNLKNIEAPYVPKLKDELDTSFFRNAENVTDAMLIEDTPGQTFLQKISSLRRTDEFQEVTAFSKDVFTRSPSQTKDDLKPENQIQTEKFFKTRRHSFSPQKENKLVEKASLNQLSIRDWKVLCTGASRIVRKKDTVIIREGQTNKSLYRIKSGSVRIEKNTPKGKVVIGFLEKNQVFGEMSFIGNNNVEETPKDIGNVSASVVVNSSDAEFYKIDRDFIFSLFLVEKDLFARFFKILALMLAERIVSLPFEKEVKKTESESQIPPHKENVDKIALDLRPSPKTDPDKDKTKIDQKFCKRFKLPPGEVVIQRYDCTLLGKKKGKYHGKLYIGERHLCFDSLIFGYRHKEVVQFKDITQICTPENAMIIDVFVGNEKQHSFVLSSEKEADEVFMMLDTLCDTNKYHKQEDESKRRISLTGNSGNRRSTGGGHRRMSSFGSSHVATVGILEEEELEKELSLSQDDWNLILQGSNCKTFTKDEVILSGTSSSRSIYQIAHGSCRVEKKDEEGKIVVLGMMSPPEMFGEISFLTGRGPTVSILANENNVDIYSIDQDFIIGNLFPHYPSIAGKFYKFLSWVLVNRIHQREYQVLEEYDEKT